MADSNVSLLYTADFDGSRVLAGLAHQDEAFLQSDQVAQKAATESAAVIGKVSQVVVRALQDVALNYKKDSDAASAAAEAERLAAKAGEESSAHHATNFSLHHQEIRRTLSESYISFEIFSNLLKSGSLDAHQGISALSVGLLSFASMGPATILMGVGLAIAFIASHLHEANSEMEKASKDVSWYGDADKVQKVNEALLKYNETTKGFSQSSGQAQQAQDEFKRETGLSYEATVKAAGGVDALNMRMEQLGDATVSASVAMRQLNSLEANKELISAKGDLNIATAGDDPIARAKAEGEKRRALYDNQQAIIKEKTEQANQSLAVLQAQSNAEKDEKEKRATEKEIDRKKDEIEKLTSMQENAAEINKINSFREFVEIETIREKARKEKERREEEEINKENSRADKKEAEHIKKIAAFAKKQSDEAIKIDEEKTKRTYELQDKFDAANTKVNPLAKLKQQEKQELEIVNTTEQGKQLIRDRYRILTDKLQEDSLKKSSDDLAANMKTIAGQWHEFGLLYKAAAEEKNIVDTMGAAEASYNWAATWGGPVAGAIAAAIAVAAGVANGVQIASAKFESGGPVYGPSHSGGGVRAELEGGEHVLSRSDVSRMGGHAGVQAAKNGGSSVYSPINITIHGSAGQDTINKIAAVVTSRNDQLHDFVMMGREAKYGRVRNFDGTF